MVKSILIAFGVVTSIFLMFFISLISGISINNISIDNININGLYLKYDKKLIFFIKKLKISPSKEESKIEFDSNWLIYGNQALNYFKLIKINDIEFEKEHLYLEYKNNIFNIKHKFLEFNLTQNINIKNGTLKFTANTNKIKDIKFINNYIKLDKEIQTLINKQFTFEYIELITLNGQETLSNITKINENDISLKFLIKKPKLKYQTYPTVSLNDIIITLNNGNIDINISKANATNEINTTNNIITFNGDIKTTLKNIKTEIVGSLYYKDVRIDTNNTIENKTINYQLSTNKFKDIKVFEEFIAIPKGIRKWAVVRLKSKTTKIDNISGKIYIKEKVDVDFNTLRVDASLDDIVMDYNPTRAYPLKAKKVQVQFDGKDMNIKLTKPISNDVDLNGSEAIIYDMFGDSGLLLKLQTISPLNWTLVRAVKSYDVNIADELGIRQTQGKSDIKVKIDIPFSEEPTDVFVQILNKDSVITVKENPLKFDIFNFVYKDKKVFIKDTTLIEKGNIINIKDLLFDINTSTLNLNLDAQDINKTFAINLINTTNLEHNNTKGDINIKFVEIKDIASIKDKTIPYRAIFGKNINAILPSLGISYEKKDRYNYLKIDEIAILEDMIIPLKQAGLETASLNIKTKDFNIINLNINNLKPKTNDINQTIDISISSNIDLNNSSSNGNIFIHKLKHTSILDLNNANIPYNTKFKDDISLNFPTLDIAYLKKKDNNNIDIKSFKKLSKIVKVMQDNNITKGSINIKTKDFANMIVRLNLDIAHYGIFHQDTHLKDITLDANITNMKKISVKDTKDMITANINMEDKLTIDLSTKELGIYYKTEDINETDEKKKEPLKKCENIILDLPNITLNMKNGYFKYNDNLINYENINTKINKDNIYLTLNKNDTNVNLFLEGKQIYTKIDNLSSDFLSEILGKEMIDSGYINLLAYGTQCYIKGKGVMKNLNIKDAKILNNIFLVINSAPAIINPLLILPNAYRFATDKFQLSEYEIKEGNLDFAFNRDKDILDIPKMSIKGVHSDFKGEINIDLYNEKIKSKIDIIFMKDYAKIIRYIPLVNYIILGDEGRFSYSANIDGNLTTPKVTTHMAKETVMAPVNMIKRVFLLPTLPFRDTNTTK